MKIKNVCSIGLLEKQRSVEINLGKDGKERTIITLVGINLRINIENSDTIEVFVDERQFECKGCNGHKTVFYSNGTNKPDEVTCPDCGGTGKTI